MTANLIDRLGHAAADLAAARRRPPGATYRLQMHVGYTIQDALKATEYLHALGITHAYTSSLLAAKPGSTHGYDVCNHAILNPEIGTEDDLSGWTAALRERGMGLILDTVPNHMSVGCANAWWTDVLENGPSSPYSQYFDIAWYDHPRVQLGGKVLLPILGDTYGQVLESGQLKPVFAAGAFHIRYCETNLPIDPRTYGSILTPALESAKAEFGSESADVLELQSIITAVRHLPPRDESDSARRAEGRVEACVIKRRLADLAGRAPGVVAHVLREVDRLAGDANALDFLLEAQAYRPSFWRVASDEINYRRFFDVNDLAALSTESEEVFRAIHQKIFAWLGAGTVDGLRIDHPDGLFDPKQYLDRLQQYFLLACARHILETNPKEYDGLTWDTAEGPLRERLTATDSSQTGSNGQVSRPPLYVVVEKILGRNERLADDWRCDGTTGYEFINAVNGLFVDAKKEAALTAVYQRLTALDDAFDEIVYRCKFLILQSSLSSELHVLAHHLDRLAQAERWSRDYTLNGLRHALREVIACFPVYRSYIAGAASTVDRTYVLRAIRRARGRNPLLGRRVFEFIRDTLLQKDPPSGPAPEAYREAQRRFAGKFEQTTAPVMAKGLEDTSFYQFNRLVSLNEVGGDPGRFGYTPADVHAMFRDRAARFPAGLSPLATHDTKRGEDVRARINVLSEMPDEWGRRAEIWSEQNRKHRIEVEEGVTAPDANEEYFLYQTLVGAWPFVMQGDDDRATFISRIREYMNKVLHEAKVHSSWINPDADYDAAVGEFISRILDPEKSAAFLEDFREFQQTVARLGVWNSLAQTLIRCTAPGAPDTYQGTELWDLNLVDPDNRRPVDYAARASLLKGLDERAASDLPGLVGDLVARPDDGRGKLFVTSRALRYRRDHAEVFAGGYEPVTATGKKADHLFAYLRTSSSETVLVVAPRLVAGLLGEETSAPLGERVWADTALQLPDQLIGREWRNVLTATTIRAEGAALRMAEILQYFPVAVLVPV
ncbi:malto-oligosyltrehalose synthase [Fimbriiglobus ruber]|uniref:Malto-oligosyltrehalose synthase n=1 Tax=Fimbriiglobus ruber TaxID=1908690 RepID=A0A225D564_9BACT|nr:malto-oligosyltrehalose synthase [Fimbriiglobus ruber]OWK34774.1 Malto-oligosyltrehalose synthase [Fimbriiglobus ruber]